MSMFLKTRGLISDVFEPLEVQKLCLWVPVTTAWRILKLRMEEWSLMWRVAANKLNKQSRTADKGWFSIFGFGRGANNSSP